MLFLTTRVLAVAAVLAVASPGFAQATVESDPGQASQPEPAPPSPEAEAFHPIHKRFVLLHDSLRNKGEISPGDLPVILALHNRVLAFREQWPDYVHALAVDYQLSKWLKDDERADDLKLRLVELMPENVPLRLSWAEELRQENRYAEAAAFVEEAGYDLPKTPQAALLLARCYFADQRFQEALDLLESVVDDDLPENRSAKSQIDSLTPTLRDYTGFWVKEQEIRAAEAEADDLPRVELITDRGRIVVELFENEAPNTVANFISLVEKGFYDQCRFHRVIPNFMAQTGDPNSKPDGNQARLGRGGPGYYIPDELDSETARKHFTGTLSMANHGPGTGGSQFFLTHEPTHYLNGRHTVFGRVTEGLDALRSLEIDDVLQSGRVLRKRDHLYEPATIPDPTAPMLIPPRAAEPPDSPPEAEPEDDAPGDQ